MRVLNAAVTVVLALSAGLANAGSASGSIEDRLQKLEAEQAQMQQQQAQLQRELVERDAMIQELRREIQAQGATTTAGTAAATQSAGTVAGRTDGPWQRRSWCSSEMQAERMRPSA